MSDEPKSRIDKFGSYGMTKLSGDPYEMDPKSDEFKEWFAMQPPSMQQRIIERLKLKDEGDKIS